MKKFVSVPLFVLALVISLASISFRTAPADGEIKLTVAELNQTPFEKLIVADDGVSIESCVVSVEVGKEVKEYTIKWYAQPEELKSYLASVKPGTKILVQKRIAATADGKKKLPSVVYTIVEKH